MVSDQAFWLAGIAIALSVLSIAFWRGFEIDEISLLQIRLKLPKPLKFSGHWLALPVLISFFAIGLSAGVYGAYLIMFPTEWPAKYSQLKTAKIWLSEIDDVLTIKINEKEVGRYEIGGAYPPVDVKGYLVKGANKIEVNIYNDRYGGCGGKFRLELNGKQNEGFTKSWSSPGLETPYITCFTSVMNLFLE